MKKYALYYPTIEFSDYEWLWRASLLWDRIYRIVPSGYQPDDVSNVRELCEPGEIGIPLDPGKYAAEIADQFIERIDSGDWYAAALAEYEEEDEDGKPVEDEFRRVHNEKVDSTLRNMIIARGDARQVGDWLQIPTSLAANYMTFLAVRMAEKNDLQLLSDNIPAWTGATYFQHDGEIDDFPNEQLEHQLATLVVRDFLPQDILSISAGEICRFRDRFREERQQFLSVIQESAALLSQCEDPKIAADLVNDIKQKIETALETYRDSISYLNVASMTGLKSVSFPVVTKVATAISGAPLDVSTLVIVSAAGAGIGVVSGIKAYQEKRKKLDRESDYSYLLHLSRRWKKQTPLGRNHDYNCVLWRSLEEFIND